MAKTVLGKSEFSSVVKAKKEQTKRDLEKMRKIIKKKKKIGKAKRAAYK